MSKKKPAKDKTKQGPSEPAPVESPPSSPPMEGPQADSAWLDGGRPSVQRQAQELVYDAWEAPTRRRAVALAKKALRLSPDCADAYNVLAEETAKTLEEAIELYRKGVQAGERAIGERAFTEDVGHFWGILETRPYMRARAGLAQCLWEAGQREEAVEHYRDLLRLNPNDNQGIRDLLMPCLIELGRDHEAETLFREYQGDCMAVWMYSRVLLDFRRFGDSPQAVGSLKAALRWNRHVPAYLLGRKRIPRTLPATYGVGGDEEAVLYAYGNRAAWEATPGAIQWLAANVE